MIEREVAFNDSNDNMQLQEDFVSYVVQRVLEKKKPELDELERATDPRNVEEEIGDVLFAVAALGRKLGVDPESALRRTVRGFAERYERMRTLARQRGVDLEDLSDDELRRLFREARTARRPS